MKNGMLAKSYAVAMMDMKKTKFYLGADAIKLRLAQLKQEQAEAKGLLESCRDRLWETEERINTIDAVDWKAFWKRRMRKSTRITAGISHMICGFPPIREMRR